MVRSLAEHDEAIRQRIDTANAALHGISTAGDARAVEVLPELGDGFCFLRAVSRQLGPQLGLDHRDVAFLGLVHLARNLDEFGNFVDDEFTEVRLHTLSLTGKDVLNLLSLVPQERRSLHAFLWDSFEGLLAEDFSPERRYADELLITGVCRALGITVFVFNAGQPAAWRACVFLLFPVSLSS